MFRRSCLALACGLIFSFGCGGGASDSVGDVPAQQSSNYGYATIRISQQIRGQIVPARVDTVRITGFEGIFVGGVWDARGGGSPYPPREMSLAPTYTLENVPTNVNNILIEYLDGDVVIGMYFQDVKLTNGQVYTIVDPALVTRPEELNFFSIFTGWLPPGEIIKCHVGEQYGVGAEPVPFPSNQVAEYLYEPMPPWSNEPIDPQDPEFGVYQMLRKFTVWEVSDPTIATAYNGSTFNSDFRTGAVRPKKPGRVTLTARFFDLTSTTEIEFVEPRPYPWVETYLNEKTSDRWEASGHFFARDPEPREWQADVTEEVIYRLSDDPAVADWDRSPGRKGYIVRGSKPGKVALWARHPKQLNWSVIVVENATPE